MNPLFLCLSQGLAASLVSLALAPSLLLTSVPMDAAKGAPAASAQAAATSVPLPATVAKGSCSVLFEDDRPDSEMLANCFYGEGMDRLDRVRVDVPDALWKNAENVKRIKDAIEALTGPGPQVVIRPQSPFAGATGQPPSTRTEPQQGVPGQVTDTSATQGTAEPSPGQREMVVTILEQPEGERAP